MMREYTPREAAVLAGTTIGAVQKAITSRAVEARRDKGRRLLSIDGIYAIAVAASAPSTLRVSYRAIKPVVRTLLGSVPRPGRIPLDSAGAWLLDARRLDKDIRARIRLYDRAREGLIERNPEILGGTPVIRGTRLNVYAIAGRLEHGETVDELRAEYPYVTREEIQAALLYARANPLRGRPGGRPWQKKRKSRSS
jgi:uncharacterized protein (DUF433 family)